MTNWKTKLAAYLHDPPSKALDIQTHVNRSDAAFRQAGFVDAEIGDYYSGADHAAAAADRLPFPDSRASGLRCSFDGVRNSFVHPLGQSAQGTLRLPYHAEFKTIEQAFEGENSVQPALSAASQKEFATEGELWRARLFAHWRLWPKHAMEYDYRLAMLPADTRIPDHTIWTHMQVVSALQGCVGEKGLRPAFLKLQLGPVQEFIAAARSVRDLWSGSYLLSWLMAAGLKALSAEVGPDAVIFPNLRGQSLFDLHWRKELWDKAKIGDQTVWESLAWSNSDLLIPNIPNVFLAVVPADRAAELGRKVAEVIQAEWKQIAGSVWAACEAVSLTNDEGGIISADRKTRFDNQIARFLSISWQATPWPEKLEDALKMAEGFDETMPIQVARERVQNVVNMATGQMPKEDRDSRYYVGGKDGPKSQLNNVGLGWAVILSFNSWQLDAVRQTRNFAAANGGGWQTATFNNKDALTGRDEAVAGGQEWSRRAEAVGSFWRPLFKKGDWLSASTLVKRVWHRAYLEKQWELDLSSNMKNGFPMPNTRGIAAHAPFEDCGDDESAEDAPPSEKYFAVLAFDGDEIGKWVSGEKAPTFASQLADYHDGSGTQRYGSKTYYEQPQFKGFLEARRPLSPSYHLQFSEALSNFASLCARPIVEAYNGRLIYAGGDDVLALLPADTALACAEALRLAFTGHEVKAANGDVIFHCVAPGFLSSDNRKDDHRRGRPIPFLVPGPATDASVGIAIAHFKSPLQDVVRAAQVAEKRAKNQLGKSAVAVTLFKRSGETIEWGTQWESGGLDLYRALNAAIEANEFSSKFPYQVAQTLDPYLTQLAGLAKVTSSPDFEADTNKIICREVGLVCERQRGPEWTREISDHLLVILGRYLARLDDSQQRISAVIGLCQTVAFARRTRSDGVAATRSSSPSILSSAEKQAQP
jgi:CRISPR-associated protein Cmr2